ncbi:hypothetical protein [Rivihabitans pingtungensis]|uniref:hypothetical protein n=1 Tax=Rivihabitans pingtungensis TaxID=1054498 RepID=UPI0023525790|nr:hypothetical protein [Rivihabitans pingtungensis]MCK6437594.1 hypothetical protein [Rivihabitans pingtungensis]
MTTLATRIRALSDLEGFDIQVFDHKGDAADLKTNGLPPYPHERKAKGSTTVAEWKGRFNKTYPNYSCEILEADGSVAHGNTKLESVRATYEEL